MWNAAIYSWKVITCSYLVWGLEERIQGASLLLDVHQSAWWLWQTQTLPLMLKAWADKIKGPVSFVERLHKLLKLIMRICVSWEMALARVSQQNPAPSAQEESRSCAVHSALLSAGTAKAADPAGPSHLTWGFHTPHSIDINVFDKGLQLHILTHHLVALIVDVNYILCKTADRNKKTKWKENASLLFPKMFFWPCRC